MSKTINLEQNGRIFPLWVMENFKKFIIPEIKRKEGEDPCNEVIGTELTKYQEFISEFLNYQSPFKDILVYHGLGTGKTRTAINMYNSLFNFTPKWNVFLLIPASLRDDPWLKDINQYLQKEDFDKRFANIIFIHYDSPFADKDFLEKVKSADASRQSIFIIEEAHKFINNVYNNISTQRGKRAQIIYDYIQQEQRDNNNTRVVLLTATPGVNNPYEWALIFNLLRPGTFPTSEAIFEQIYISSSNFASINENTKNMFQRRILGLVSYYLGATPDKFATKSVNYINVPMEPYFQEIYEYFERIEEEKEKIARRMGTVRGASDMSTYSAYTRQASNFVFPNINDKINGEKRPRPGQFKIKDSDAQIIDEGKNKEKKQELLKNNEQALEYKKALKVFINSTIDYFKEKLRKDKEQNKSIRNDFKIFLEKYDGNFDQFYRIEKEKTSNLFKALYECSPKMIRIIFTMNTTKGPVMVYSNYVEMEGLQMLKIYLNFFGYIDINDDKDFSLDKPSPKDNYRFMEYHGSIDKNVRRKNKEIYNMKQNAYGRYIKLIMISPAGAEGINLNNTRQVHITEPFWNEKRILQVVGRAIRMCQHKDLPMEERHVDVYRYKMVRIQRTDKTLPHSSKENKIITGKETTDERMESISRKKENLLLSFDEAIKEAAVDCELFKNINMLGSKYRCFQFNEESLFDKPYGPAYNDDINIDQKIDNGSNSKDTSKQRIRVRKVKAVKKIEEDTYSKDNIYWFNDISGVMYDYELNYPIGKTERDENGQWTMLSNDIYIITNIIDIPKYVIYEK